MVSIDFSTIMKNKRDYLGMEEIDRMLQYCYDEDRIRDYMLMLTLARTGRRVTEVVGRKPYTKYVGLRPVDIHEGNLIEWDILKKQHIKRRKKNGKIIPDEKLEELRQGKKPKRVLKPVDDEYMELLKEYIIENGITMTQRVFPLTRRRVQYIIQEVADAVGVKRSKGGIHPHMFRHSLAINLLKRFPNNPAMLLHIKELLDHSSIVVTSGYAQFLPGEIKDRLNEMFIEGEG